MHSLAADPEHEKHEASQSAQVALEVVYRPTPQFCPHVPSDCKKGLVALQIMQSLGPFLPFLQKTQSGWQSCTLHRQSPWSQSSGECHPSSHTQYASPSSSDVQCPEPHSRSSQGCAMLSSRMVVFLGAATKAALAALSTT